ncbi:amidase [Anaeromassilibacillus sp. An172]|uniref:N-acetylmuramoyl-L-alanine amidase n=1 Tax=Anaeromassilibacillus sp. An172 TaxID=1965570 RepID=UPI000B3A8C87|nr:amidase [Anaeromassilibacillus sp. An172]
MNLHKLILTANACYKAGEKITVKGIMVHSTGANNPWLKRYVGPDDGLLGKNIYNNHWNTYHPGGSEVCVHAFIGKLNDGTIATYQTLPWNHRGWHAGGSANDTHIGFEICEDGLTDKTYFDKVYKEAVELCAYLCKQYGLTEQNIICHNEGYKKGIASNHGDVMHWFPKHGKSMDTFRADVKALLSGGTSEPSTNPDTGTTIKTGDLVKITGIKYYGGQTIPTWVRNQNWYVQEVSGDRAVINKNESGTNAIMSPVRVSDLAPVSGSGATTYRVHTVAKGDTLWGIAVKYLGSGSRYKEIKTLNGLTSDTIFSGQKLKIPN